MCRVPTKRRARYRVGMFSLVLMTAFLESFQGVSRAGTLSAVDRGVPLVGLASLLRGGGEGGRAAAAAKDGKNVVAKQGQRETLYEAYNMLHTLAQVCNVPLLYCHHDPKLCTVEVSLFSPHAI